MNRVLTWFKRFDIQRAAGISRILGVDLTDEMVRVVELEKRGNLVNKYTSRLHGSKSYYRKFTEGVTIEEKARQLRDLIESGGMTATFAVSNVRTAGVKIVTTDLPAGVEDIDEWIRENYEKLIKLSLPLNQLSYGYEVIESSDSGTQVEITFVRNSDIEKYQSFFGKAGFTLLSLGAGTRDAINGLVLERKGDFTLAHVESSSVFLYGVEKGLRRKAHLIPTSDHHDLLITLERLEEDSRHSAVPLYVAGDVGPEIERSNFSLAGVFGLGPGETLAAGLAVKGFLPEISPVNLLSLSEKERSAGLMFKSLTRRVALALGSLLVVLLGLQLVSSWVIRVKTDAIEERSASAGPEHARLAFIQHDVETLMRKLEGTGGSKSNMSKTVHHLASAIPEGVWLYKLQISREVGQREEKIVLHGYSRSNEHVASFLKRLGLVYAQARLVRSSLPLQSETAVPVRGSRDPMVTFEIRAAGKN